METVGGGTVGAWMEKFLVAASGATTSGASLRLPRVTPCSLSMAPCPGFAHEHLAVLDLVCYDAFMILLAIWMIDASLIPPTSHLAAKLGF